ncbi:seleno T [Chlorella sorokiniana]|uniref:Seleno T n=1 Tax=Chlorella sorokiniana TaxID=3076 RepID=A0A2P6TZY2_CHLSO|nr:seleno T [Chlorella sorokiniana]|eukprot:PRW59621.1 seleno T [Chlorella sorokiniana]
MQVAQALRQHFGPDLQVELANHPPPPLQAALAQALFVVQLAALAVVGAGQQAAPYLERLGIVLPADYWRALQEKKMGALLGIWFIGNTIRTNLISTGAFEISYEGVPVWSKLETHSMPTLQHVVNGISQVMRAAAGGADAAAGDAQ